MVTEVTAGPPEVNEKVPADELDDRVTASAAVVGMGLPKASCI